MQSALIHGFLNSWFQTLSATINGEKRTMKIRTQQLIMISQYQYVKYFPNLKEQEKNMKN